MDNKIIFAVVVVLALLIGGVVGFYLNNNSGELVNLQEENTELRSQVSSLQNQIENQDNELDECIQEYSARYPADVRDYPPKYGIEVTFSNLLSFNDIKLFADKYEVWKGGVSGSDNNGNYLGAQFTMLNESDDIIEKFCSMKQDEIVQTISISGPFIG